MDRETPTFNLKAVVQETGIKPDTLRAWERRYGLPEPDRSTGGHRLYSQRDIDVLLWLMARQNEGLTISRAVDLWRSIESEGQDPLRAPEYTSSKTSFVQGEEIQILCKRWIDACLNFDERAAERIIAQAFAIYPVETVCIDILQRGLHEIGEGWYKNKVSVQQEHFTSALAMRRIDAMLGVSPPPTRSGRILLACPPGEEHVFGQALLQLLLRRRGWDTIYLGSNVPIERMETSVEMTRPHVVVLSAQRLPTATTLMEMAMLLYGKGVTVAYSGRIFVEAEDLRQRIPGYFLGSTIVEALDAIEDLIPNAAPVPVPSPLDELYLEALREFESHLLEINAQVTEKLKAVSITPAQLSAAHLNLEQGIVAALKLGNMGLINQDMEWIRGLLINHKIDGVVLSGYMKLYTQVAHTLLGEAGRPILDWLDKTSTHLVEILGGQPPAKNGFHS